MTLLRDHLDVLAGCRFCPMCKPASETGRLLQVESYSTRARGMMLWSIAQGHEPWTARKAEIMFQSTRDGISESWCVSHRPVSEYVLTARRNLWDEGLIPHAVAEAVNRRFDPVTEITRGTDTVVLAGEFAEVGDLDRARAAARRLGVGLVYAATGFTAYSLGATEVAAAQAKAAMELIGNAGTVIVDGPQTEYMLRRVWGGLGVTVNQEVNGIAEFVSASLDSGATATDISESPALFHDSRAATYLADSLASSRAIDPSFMGPEEDLGTGESYFAPRRLLARLNVSLVASRWSRSLSRSCGSDDGLWATYPDIANGLARETVHGAGDSGAGRIIVDSPACRAALAGVAGDDIEIVWVGELLRDD